MKYIQTSPPISIQKIKKALRKAKFFCNTYSLFIIPYSFPKIREKYGLVKSEERIEKK